MRFKAGFAPAGLCYGPVATVAVVAMAAGSVYSGMEANKAAKAQASLIEDQAQLAKQEADRAADQKAVERRKFLAEQRMAYSASGISMEGTPLEVGADTWKEFQMEIDALRRSGAAQLAFGQREAETTRATGRAQLVSGILQGVGTAGMGAYKIGSLSSAGATTSAASKTSFSSQSLSKGLFA